MGLIQSCEKDIDPWTDPPQPEATRSKSIPDRNQPSMRRKSCHETHVCLREFFSLYCPR